MTSAVLTSPENLDLIKQKAEKREAIKLAKEKKTTKPPAKRGRPPKKPQEETEEEETEGEESSSEEDLDFCMICIGVMPRHTNSRTCKTCASCERPFHSKCIKSTVTPFICFKCR